MDDNRIKHLEDRIAYQWEEFNGQIRDQRKITSGLIKRVNRNERLLSLIFQTLVMVGGYFGGKNIVEYWKAGDLWGVSSVVMICFILILWYRETVPNLAKLD